MLNAFITICAERAREEARRAEAAIGKGGEMRPLEGVPFSVKDLVNTGGVRTTFGSVAFAENVPASDSVSVARLRAAGAILLGKTTTPEFGHKPFTEAPLFGKTRNAWDQTRTSGGSSGGAAVAAASGLGPLAVATDGGGSTRIPAACNGVVGHKQTLGLVPHDMTPDAFGNNSYITPTTRTVKDTALMLQAMAGPHRADPRSLGILPKDYVAAVDEPRDLRGKRIGFVARLGNDAVSSEVLRATQEAAALFRSFGATVEDASFDLPNTEPDWLVLTLTFWRTRFWPIYERIGERMSETLVRQMKGAEAYSAVDFEKAVFARTEIFRRIQAWFDGYDLLLMPTLTRTALGVDDDFFAPILIDNQPTDTVRRAWYPYTHPFNLSGNPACTVPCGFGADGLPMALQIVGRWFEDDTVLRAAALYERERPWAQRRPALPQLAG